MGNYRIELQEHPEYGKGWEAFNRGQSNFDNPHEGGKDLEAWRLGWQDAEDEKIKPWMDV